ncbi:DUF2946 family protein [Thauera linaloolentis]|uniref:DUF2946 family protein n=1 Tax=Thauera linaloolentis (strain DSM 12138 / JCM 21573 / CCUG 41526 / CIP 105981 / IAM 15112 / NBRC 102519 / 47Lol) TaxID=1123367 RepID=N6Z9D4_THAL4|nr:DUF2946 family protein [Thauera linaloolentis]ENO88764.1 hypothetical protein C666_08050 [Thauera linaloolentis 47Lol = DSM 12138]MCM8564927.1 DUF2946 family protein [Thauera linaloolentis]
MPDCAGPSSLPHWPTVPACYGWLSLDARGRWRLKGEVIAHPGLIAFLNARYTHDAEGRWLVNNGPQRVYVKLESAPWVLRLQPNGGFVTHTGRRTAVAGPLLLDAEGRVFLATGLGPAALDDRDLAMLIADVGDASGKAADDDALCALMSGERPVHLRWKGLPLQGLAAAGQRSVAAFLGFVPDPQPEEA